MTYRALLRYAWDVARSHWLHWRPRVRAFAWECGYVAGVIAVTMPIGITLGAHRAEQRAVEAKERHAEDLRRVVPVAEAALEAHRAELEALGDTIEAIPALEWEVEP